MLQVRTLVRFVCMCALACGKCSTCVDACMYAACMHVIILSCNKNVLKGDMKRIRMDEESREDAYRRIHYTGRDQQIAADRANNACARTALDWHLRPMRRRKHLIVILRYVRLRLHRLFLRRLVYPCSLAAAPPCLLLPWALSRYRTIRFYRFGASSLRRLQRCALFKSIAMRRSHQN